MANNYKETSPHVFKADGLRKVDHIYMGLDNIKGIVQTNFCDEIKMYPIQQGLMMGRFDVAVFYPKGKRPSCLPAKN